MKIVLFITGILSIVAFTTIMQPAAASAPLAGQPARINLSQQAAAILPAGYTIPAMLPAYIQDPTLLAGWVYLWNQQEPLRTWDGQPRTPLTGRMLAQYLLDNQVEVRWNAKNACDGHSCTVRPNCQGQPCTAYQDGRNHNPILVSVEYQDPAHFALAELAGTLAHEAIHHQLPFGDVADSQYEEFWAFSVGYQVARSRKLQFSGVEPLRQACLRQWFQDSRIDYYGGLRAYPPSIQAQADIITPTCVIQRALPGETSGFPTGK